jgi:hypothetical protein
VSALPPLGPEQPGDLHICQRAVDGWDTLCGKPATWHVIWDASCENSIACDGHASEGLEPWHALQVHPLGADCGMPGSEWIPDERRCVFPADDAEVAMVKRTTAQECPA